MIEVVDRDGGLEEEILNPELASNCDNCSDLCGNSVRTASFVVAGN